MSLSIFLSTPFNPNLEFQIITTNVLPLSVCCAFVISAQEQVVQFYKREASWTLHSTDTLRGK